MVSVMISGFVVCYRAVVAILNTIVLYVQDEIG